MTAPLTKHLGEFIAGLCFVDLPDAVRDRIGHAFADCAAVMVVGASEPAPGVLRKVLSPSGTESTLIGSGGCASAPEAAWINGTAAHALDFDDSSRRGGHTSAVLVPAILAEAEAQRVSGARVVAAYAAGFETMSELIWRDKGEHHLKGWHPTGVFGTVAAAAACASLRGLDARQASMAIAIAASQSAGLIANVGTMTKPFHAGSAAHAGVIAARLAHEGFTAGEDAFEHAPGFFDAFAAGGEVDVESPVSAGRVWRLVGENAVGTKQYPMCYYTHRTLDGMLDLLAATLVTADEVERITVSLSPRNATILRYALPQTGLEAKFSIQFACAGTIVAAGRPGLAELSDEFVSRPHVQALMKRVTVIRDERPDPNLPGYAVYDQVVIDTRDGRRIEGPRVNKIRGGPDIPLSREALWLKFDDCLRQGGVAGARDLFDRILSLEIEKDVSTLVRRLVPQK